MLSKGINPYLNKYGFLNFKILTENMKKCICQKDNSEDVRWNPFETKINYGEIYLYKKYKIKFNKKNQKFKLVRPTQMGNNLYEIYDINENKLLELNEDRFSEHFDIRIFNRNDFLEKLLNE